MSKAEDFMRGRKAVHDHILLGNQIPPSWTTQAETCIANNQNKAFYQGVLVTIGTLPIYYKQYARPLKVEY